MADDAITCDVCGELLPRQQQRPRQSGVGAIRQGRKSASAPVLPDEPRGNIPEYGDFDMSPLPPDYGDAGVRRGASRPAQSFGSKPDTRRGVPVRGSMRTRQVVVKHGRPKAVKAHPVNWALISVICIVLAMGAGIGYMLYMRNSDTGHAITARKNTLSCNDAMLELATSTDAVRLKEREAMLKTLGDAPAQSYWNVGGEYLDMGDMADAIMAFRIADVLDPENYDGLLELGEAYELDNNDEAAEAVYLSLIETVNPARADAYTSLINLYLDNERRPEAADMMLTAYQATARENFNQLRNDLIPNTPEVDVEHTSGRYELAQEITLTSPQGYDIYYTLDSSAELPDGGTLLTGDTVTIPEGSYTLRAVAVSGDLVSDMMSVSYTVYYPTPAAPRCNLAPNTYSSKRAVSLRAGDTGETKEERKKKTAEQLEKQDTLTFYYTFDGSTPDPAISPIYDGTPIELPSGSVTLRAIAINGYGKQSSTMEVGYKFNIKPALALIYAEEDVFGDFVLNSTTLDEFKSVFGEPKSTADTTYLFQDGSASHLEYPWGYAVFLLEGNTWHLVRVEMNNSVTTAPRGVGFGSTESEIVAAYKDMGMPDNQDGTRNLYYNDPKIGKILFSSDGDRIVQYQCATLDSKNWVLQYWLKNGKCVKIVNYYQP